MQVSYLFRSGDRLYVPDLTACPQGRCAVLGVFDGVHLGHAALIEAAENVRRARGGGEIVLVTFSGLGGFSGYKERGGFLIGEDERQDVLERLGVDRMIVCTFDDVRDMTDEAFVRTILVGALFCDTAVCGENFRFGRGREGDAARLTALMRAAGGDAVVVPTVCCYGKPVSSTRIHTRLEAGDIPAVNALLGRHYQVSGTVEGGNQLGRTFGFATANLTLDRGRTSPACGVYLTACRTPDGILRPAVSYLGTRPTISPVDDRVLETHILDYEGDLYGADVTVVFYGRLGGEKKYSSEDELKKSARQFICQAREYWDSHSL